MVITGLTRNQLYLVKGTVGSNPTVSANANLDFDKSLGFYFSQRSERYHEIILIILSFRK